MSIVIVLVVLVGIGIASIASMAMAAAVPISFLVLYLTGTAPYDSTFAYIVGGIISAAIILWSLRPNIRRLIAGNERLVGPRARRVSKRKGTEEEPVRE